ncbi:TlyA family RNA methyltransferase [Parvularcula maris]|uniref:TlyA family RNA methyltransferase n=1 Tax=Parvularcula maris TaxID=2965077 RepID=A0A9X2LA22_9PROT|nr:TlyA family RNA methyltransferase [Parvularcula maris]MCQ8185741.1 TlyA family RNA methyltransferase [Parvularcula maris]
MRLDQALVERGLVPSRSRARDLILQGQVIVGGRTASKPGQKVGDDDELSLSPEAHDYVSRAALKLEGALNTFPVDPMGRVAADIGSSTGGFTEVLLRRGAAKVYAVDVGTAQLHERLRSNERVVSLEGLNAKDLTAAHVPDRLGLIVSDISFISLLKALPPALALAEEGADLITLVKPQFEMGREVIGKNGAVLASHAEQRSFIQERIVPGLQKLGWEAQDLIDSPLLGGEGTKEFLLHAAKTTA